MEGYHTTVGPPDPLHHDEIWYGSVPHVLLVCTLHASHSMLSHACSFHGLRATTLDVTACAPWTFPCSHLPTNMLSVHAACFENTVQALYKYVVPKPKAECTKTEQLGVSFAAGYIAGVFCAVVSHPADNLVSKLNSTKGATMGSIVSEMGWCVFSQIAAYAYKGMDMQYHSSFCRPCPCSVIPCMALLWV